MWWRKKEKKRYRPIIDDLGKNLFLTVNATEQTITFTNGWFRPKEEHVYVDGEYFFIPEGYRISIGIHKRCVRIVSIKP